MDNKNIGDKEWLDLAWKYYQQQSQQRFSIFNFFVVFSTILISGYVNALDKGFTSIGITIGLLQIFLTFMFLKIEARNKFMTKHAENIIKKLEAAYFSEGNENYSLFSSEEQATNELRQLQAKQSLFSKQWSFRQSFALIYKVFITIGLLAIVYALLQKDRGVKMSQDQKLEQVHSKDTIIVLKDSSGAAKLDSLIQRRK